MLQQTHRDTESRMKSLVDKLRKELGTVRTGQASASLLDGIAVEYYGNPTPLNQLSSISIPEPSLLVVQPWDITAIKDIEKAISRSDLGLVPNSDGRIIRIPIPPLTEERRKELAKRVKDMAETTRVAIRVIRREANETIKKAQKTGEISEDEENLGLEKTQQLTDEWVKKVDDLLKAKEKEILEF